MVARINLYIAIDKSLKNENGQRRGLVKEWEIVRLIV